MVEKSGGKVAVPPGAELTARRAYKLLGIEVRKHTLAFGQAGGPMRWSVGAGGMQCFVSVVDCQSCGVPTRVILGS